MDLAIRQADGVKIRFAEAGRGRSETAVLTSPWPESLLAFRKVWDRLAEQFHLVAIHLRDLVSPSANSTCSHRPPWGPSFCSW
jgi:pimeloyl-ACP methyl ester carboxylesterase